MKVKEQRRIEAGAGNEAALVNGIAEQLRQAMFRRFVRLGAEGEAPDQAALTVGRSQTPIAPARLAARHPPGSSRVQARALYERCLAHYRGAVRPQDEALGTDDVGAAAANFVIANLAALQTVELTPPLMLRLERQLSAVVRGTGAWDTASATDRQAYFEQMAVIAVLIRETWAQAALQGAAAQANVRRAARNYLTQLLGVDPDQLTLGADGLTLREPTAPAARAG